MDAYFLLRAFAALVFVLSLIGGLAWAARRFGLLNQSRPGRQLQVVESCTLDARHRIVLFRCGTRHHVALIGPNTCQFLNDEIALGEVAAGSELATKGALAAASELAAKGALAMPSTSPMVPSNARAGNVGPTNIVGLPASPRALS